VNLSFHLTTRFEGLGKITTSTGDHAMTSISENCSLFEIDTELDALLEQIEEQVETEGEPSEELLSRFREFCAAHGEKVDRIGRFVRMMEAREQHCRAEAARLGERARSTAAKVDRTKSMVLFYLMSRELKKIEGREFTLRIQKNSQDSVRILDELILPTAYRRIEARVGGVLWETVLSFLPEELERAMTACVREMKPDTEAIKAASMRHEEVAGAEVRRGSHLRVA
jgi:Siphovirus Gp157